MPVKSPVPTAVLGPKNLNVSGPYPYPGEPQASWDARYAAAAATTPLRYLGHWNWSDELGVGDVAAANPFTEIKFNVTGSEHSADQARLEALAAGDVIAIQQPKGSNTLVLSAKPTTTAGVTTCLVDTEVPVGVIYGSTVTEVWITPK
jgi:hypothetical protein